ncbi:hypothetical protein AYI70_g6140 [Smittium culicis]|uniref:Uncharacterized protein n=1 Tax=Smittium culicis TaxID=133412 RepID=A0A1R1XRD7_9FUNG|nr:hypothetical protein AYI70_g6140 [Smittium culicis]
MKSSSQIYSSLTPISSNQAQLSEFKRLIPTLPKPNTLSPKTPGGELYINDHQTQDQFNDSIPDEFNTGLHSIHSSSKKEYSSPNFLSLQGNSKLDFSSSKIPSPSPSSLNPSNNRQSSYNSHKSALSFARNSPTKTLEQSSLINLKTSRPMNPNENKDFGNSTEVDCSSSPYSNTNFSNSIHTIDTIKADDAWSIISFDQKEEFESYIKISGKLNSQRDIIDNEILLINQPQEKLNSSNLSEKTKTPEKSIDIQASKSSGFDIGDLYVPEIPLAFENESSEKSSERNSIPLKSTSIDPQNVSKTTKTLPPKIKSLTISPDKRHSGLPTISSKKSHQNSLHRYSSIDISRRSGPLLHESKNINKISPNIKNNFIAVNKNITKPIPPKALSTLGIKKKTQGSNSDSPTSPKIQKSRIIPKSSNSALPSSIHRNSHLPTHKDTPASGNDKTAPHISSISRNSSKIISANKAYSPIASSSRSEANTKARLTQNISNYKPSLTPTVNQSSQENKTKNIPASISTSRAHKTSSRLSTNAVPSSRLSRNFTQTSKSPSTLSDINETDLEKNYKILKSSIQALQLENSKLESTLNESKNNSIAIKSESEKIGEYLKSKILTLEKELEIQKKSFFNELEEQKKNLDLKNQRISNLESQIKLKEDQHSNKIQEINNKHTVLLSKIKNDNEILSTSVTQAESERKNLKESLINLSYQVTVKQGMIDNLNENIIKKSESIKQLEALVEELNNPPIIKEYEDMVINLTTERNKLKSEIDSFKQQSSNRCTELSNSNLAMLKNYKNLTSSLLKFLEVTNKLTGVPSDLLKISRIADNIIRGTENLTNEKSSPLFSNAKPGNEKPLISQIPDNVDLITELDLVVNELIKIYQNSNGSVKQSFTLSNNHSNTLNSESQVDTRSSHDQRDHSSNLGLKKSSESLKATDSEFSGLKINTQFSILEQPSFNPIAVRSNEHAGLAHIETNKIYEVASPSSHLSSNLTFSPSVYSPATKNQTIILQSENNTFDNSQINSHKYNTPSQAKKELSSFDSANNKPSDNSPKYNEDIDLKKDLSDSLSSDFSKLNFSSPRNVRNSFSGNFNSRDITNMDSQGTDSHSLNLIPEKDRTSIGNSSFNGPNSYYTTEALNQCSEEIIEHKSTVFNPRFSLLYSNNAKSPTNSINNPVSPYSIDKSLNEIGPIAENKPYSELSDTTIPLNDLMEKLKADDDDSAEELDDKLRRLVLEKNKAQSELSRIPANPGHRAKRRKDELEELLFNINGLISGVRYRFRHYIQK